jgi:phosphoribosylamine--glycine ligase
VFHAGSALSEGRVVTAGGRVLCAVGLGETVGDAQAAAYALADRIRWPGIQYRRDIGHRAIAREVSAS